MAHDNSAEAARIAGESLARAGFPKRITPERLAEIEQAMNRAGPANCWTGTTGTLAAMIHELLSEREGKCTP